jgi:hypothetical protein
VNCRINFGVASSQANLAADHEGAIRDIKHRGQASLIGGLDPCKYCNDARLAAIARPRGSPHRVIPDMSRDRAPPAQNHAGSMTEEPATIASIASLAASPVGMIRGIKTANAASCWHFTVNEP